MNTHRTQPSSRQCLTGSKPLSLVLVTLLLVPPFGFATTRAALPLKSGPYAVSVPFVTLASAIEVNTTGDGNNVNPNAGCDADPATPGEQCTLRAAIQRAEVLAGDDTITFNIPTTEPDCVVASGVCTINLTDGLQLSTSIAFVGPGADKLTVRRSTSGNYRVFVVLSTGTVSFSGLTISNGNTTSVGGGILYASNGTVNVTECVVSENRASSGGGIANSSTGTVNITNSIILGNSVVGGAPSRGGGILVNSGTVNVTNSIIGGNSSSGGGIRNVSGTMNISNSTIAGNDGGGLYADVTGPTTVKSTIIFQNAGPSAGANVSGSFTSDGFNLIGVTNGSEGFTQPTDQTGTSFEPLDAKLTNAQIFGFPVLAQPLCDSPALDKGTSAGLNGTPPTDVRGAGFPRTIDDPELPNAAGGEGTDIGAFERAVCSQNQFIFTVNKTGDADDLNPGDLICDSDAGAIGQQCTLRAAIEEANVVQNDPNQSVTRTINFAIPMTEPDCDAATGACIVNLTKALPEVSASVSIEGPGADKLTVRRNSSAAYRIFTISSLPEVVTISGLTVSNGFAMDSGGGIAFFSDFSNPRVLNVVGCKLSDNHAGMSGGGIAAVNIGRATLNVTNSTISNNFTDAVPTGSSMVGGGGIAFTGLLGTLSITNSTISDNITTGDGGGLYSAVVKNVSITNSQFIGNQAEQVNARGGGILSIHGPLGYQQQSADRQPRQDWRRHLFWYRKRERAFRGNCQHHQQHYQRQHQYSKSWRWRQSQPWHVECHKRHDQQ